jgi:hypothetical protein
VVISLRAFIAETGLLLVNAALCAMYIKQYSNVKTIAAA